MFHDIREPDLINEKKIIIHHDPLIDTQPFDPRYFRPLMVTLRVALHNITAHLLHVKKIEIFILRNKFFLIYFYSIVIMNHVRLDFVNDFVLK